MIDVSVLRLVLLAITGWLDRRARETLAYLIEENRFLRRQIARRRLLFTDEDRRRLAVRAHTLGRQALRDIATVVARPPLRPVLMVSRPRGNAASSLVPQGFHGIHTGRATGGHVAGH